MWFNQKKSAEQYNPQTLLDELVSNGIELNIDELIRYQTKSSLINLAAAKSSHGKMSGNYLARSKGRGMEFDEVRHYQNGDDIRAIDWRVTARTGKTHTKFSETNYLHSFELLRKKGNNLIHKHFKNQSAHYTSILNDS